MEFFREFIARTGISLSKFIKAKIITTALSLIVLLIGFFFLDIPYWPLVALGIGLVDLLPFLGGGIILIPWALLALLSSRASLGLWLLVIYIITFLIHQIIEPIILGREVGLKPLYTFLIMTISVIVFGPWGALVGSILTVLLPVLHSMKDLKRDQ